jgi:hypothetical protein
VKIKLIAMCISSLTIACASYANGSTISDSSSNLTVQKQISALKAQVTSLEKDRNNLSFNQTSSSRNYIDQNTAEDSSLRILEIDGGRNRLPLGRMPSYRYPLALLQARDSYSNHSVILGGYIQSNTKRFWGNYIDHGLNNAKYVSGYGTHNTTGRIYIASNLGRYVQTDLTLEGSQSINPFVKEAFITIGNLKSTPFYMTIGKTRMYLGKFSGGSLTINGLTQALFQPGYKSNVTLGYAKGNLIANVSVFGSSSHKKLNALYSISYGNKLGEIKYSGVLGYVHDIQGTGMGILKQPKNSVTGDKTIPTNDKNPVINLDGRLNYRNYSISAGYATTALSKVYTNNARASAFYVQGSYSVPVFSRNTTFSLAYNHAYNTQKLAFNQLGGSNDSSRGIRELYTASIQRPFFTSNALVGLEYGRMITYSNSASSQVLLDLSVYI